MNEENFIKWNLYKQKVENKNNSVKFKEREICFVNLGKNIGSEQDGKGNELKRPVIILKRFNNNIFLAIPLTNKIKDNKYYFEFIFLNKKSSAILSQIRLLDSKRIERKIGYISEIDFINLKKKLIKIIM